MLKHLLNASDLSKENLEYVLTVAHIIAANPSRFGEIAKGKILATLFFEPSTRTRLSFESAMHRLGGSVVGFSDMSSSSSAKGESLEDTTKIVSCYCDVIAVRHPEAFTPHRMSGVSTVPIVNAGDGANEHPTQTLTDLCAIKEKYGRLDHLTVGLCGDLKYGRTTHSLARTLAQYPGNKFYFIAPDELAMPTAITDEMDEMGIDYTITDDLEGHMDQLDILYMTRIQRERFTDLQQYQALKGYYILDAEKMERAKEEMIVLHPLPRIDEIATEVDKDPRAWYFRQAQLGVYARMALLIFLLDLQDRMSEEIIHIHQRGKLVGKPLSKHA